MKPRIHRLLLAIGASAVLVVLFLGYIALTPAPSISDAEYRAVVSAVVAACNGTVFHENMSWVDPAFLPTQARSRYMLRERLSPSRVHIRIGSPNPRIERSQVAVGTSQLLVSGFVYDGRIVGIGFRTFGDPQLPTIVSNCLAGLDSTAIIPTKVRVQSEQLWINTDGRTNASTVPDSRVTPAADAPGAPRKPVR